MNIVSDDNSAVHSPKSHRSPRSLNILKSFNHQLLRQEGNEKNENAREFPREKPNNIAKNQRKIVQYPKARNKIRIHSSFDSIGYQISLKILKISIRNKLEATEQV